jgi:hypothetical protein
MVLYDYFEDVLGGVEFLIAFGSLIGILGLLIGIMLAIWGGSRLRYKMLGVIIFSFVLIAICGFDTGFKYFRIFR